MLSLQDCRTGWNVPVLMTAAREGQGVAELAAEVDKHRAHLSCRPEAEAFRAAYRQRWMRELILAELGVPF